MNLKLISRPDEVQITVNPKSFQQPKSSLKPPGSHIQIAGSPVNRPFLDLVQPTVQPENTKPATSAGFRGHLAVRGGFEPPVRLNTVRRFSKPVISATHPPNLVF